MATCHCSRHRKTTLQKVSKLVGKLEKFEPRLKELFELSAGCAVDATACDCLKSTRPVPATKTGKGDLAKSTGQGNDLFTPTCTPPVPQMGRQTYRMWKAMVQLGASPFAKSRLTDQPKTLHFLHLEKFNVHDFCIHELQTNSVTGFLVLFLQSFFPNLNVVLEERFDIAGMNAVSRFHEKTRKKQYLVSDIYTRLHQVTGFDKRRYILGLTWTDLYPSEEMNFALGEALFSHRCAVLCFGRYEPLTFTRNDAASATSGQVGESVSANFNPESDSHLGESSSFAPSSREGFSSNEEKHSRKEQSETVTAPSVSESLILRSDGESDAEKLTEMEEDVLVVTGDLLWKMMRVSSHEVCHLFGLSHCIFFKCAMNESKSVTEALDQPLQLCPICLRKLQKFFDFDIPARYRQMLLICRQVQRSYPCKKLEETIEWFERVLLFISR